MQCKQLCNSSTIIDLLPLLSPALRDILLATNKLQRYDLLFLSSLSANENHPGPLVSRCCCNNRPRGRDIWHIIKSQPTTLCNVDSLCRNIRPHRGGQRSLHVNHPKDRSLGRNTETCNFRPWYSARRGTFDLEHSCYDTLLQRRKRGQKARPSTSQQVAAFRVPATPAALPLTAPCPTQYAPSASEALHHYFSRPRCLPFWLLPLQQMPETL